MIIAYVTTRAQRSLGSFFVRRFNVLSIEFQYDDDIFWDTASTICDADGTLYVRILQDNELVNVANWWYLMIKS